MAHVQNGNLVGRLRKRSSQLYGKGYFLFISQRQIEQIEPLELLTVLQKIEKEVRWSKPAKSSIGAEEILRYAGATRWAKYNFASNLAIALNKPPPPLSD